MSRKNNLLSFRSIVDGDMSLSSLTSTVTDIQFLDNIAIQSNFTGSPVGVIAIQVSADYARDFMGNVTNSGNWATVASASTSGGSPIYFDLNQLAAPYIRVVYTKTSGSGTLNCILSAKML